MSIWARVFESERFTVSRVLKSFAADEREVETFFCNDFSLSLLCLSLSLPLFDEVMSTGARARVRDSPSLHPLFICLCRDSLSRDIR